MSDKLTLKQEKFVQEYLTNGGNASDAYRAAYNTSRMKPTTINVKASELLKNGKVTVRVQEYQNSTEKKTIVTRDFLNEKYLTLLEHAMKCVDGCKQTLNDPREARRVADSMAKMNGLVVPIGEGEEDEDFRGQMPCITVNYQDNSQQIVFNVGEPLDGDAIESTPDPKHTTETITTDYKV